MQDINREETKQNIENWFNAHSEDMMGDLGRLVGINSIKGAAEEGAPYGAESREALSLAKSMLETRGFAVSDFEDIMITADLGPSPPLMGILAHLDIVAAGDGWETDPFEMVVKEGKIFGRGVIDDKGPAVAAMYAMYCARELCPELKSGVRLILGSGEETGLEDITQYLSKNEPPPHVFSPDSHYPMINIEKGRFAQFFSASWEKEPSLPRVVAITGGKTMNVVPNRTEAVIEGMLISEAEAFCREYSEKTGASISVAADGDKLAVIAEGAATHASTPHLGVNSQTALLEMLAAMPFAEGAGFGYIRALNRLIPHGDWNGKALGIAMSDEISGELTVNFGVLNYTDTGFSGNFDSRTPICADDKDLAGLTQAAFLRESIEVTESTVSKSHHTPEESPFVQTLLRIYEEYTGNIGKCETGGGSTYVHDIPGGVAFGCAFPGVDYYAHGANEFIEVEQLIVSARMFAQAIIDMCG